MAYCVKCGVKLEESERRCPLCQTVVYHPDLFEDSDGNIPYPKIKPEVKRMHKKLKILIASIIIMIPTVLTLICDYSINKKIVWSDIVVSAVCFSYCLVFIPLIFNKKNVLLYLIIDFFSLLLFLKYIEYTIGGKWFIKFAFPISVSAALIALAAIIINRYVNPSYLLTSALVFILSGIDCVLIEFLLCITFMKRVHFIWSYYPLITFIAVGVILLICYKNQHLREQIIKRFFI